MPTVLREGGLRVVIYTDDHAPPHVYGDGETKIALIEPDVIRIVGASLREARRAIDIVREKRDYLLARWNEIHG